MININSSSTFLPNYFVRSILEIQVKPLQRAGITHLVFDLDKTLVPRGTNKLSPEFEHHLKVLQKSGFTILLGSNTRRDITVLTETIRAVAIRPSGISMKPRRSFYRQIINQAGTKPNHIAMVGDNILTDIIGANRNGLTTILAASMHHPSDYIYWLYIRHLLKRSGKAKKI